MAHTRIAAGVVIAMATAACVAWAAQGIKEGKWAMSMTMQAPGMDGQAAQAMKDMERMSPDERAMMERMMGGMGMHAGPGGAGMTVTTSQCLTNDNPVPTREEEHKCQQTHTTKGNTVTFKTVCPKSTSEGTVTYKNDSMQGTITTTETKRGKPVTTTIDISGRYEGPC